MGGKGKSQKEKLISEKESSPKKLSLKKIPWALVKIYIFFGLALVFFFLLFANSFVSKQVLEPFTTSVAFVSSKILNIFGSWTYVSGTNLSCKDFGINVVYGCNGVFATAILLSGIIAYPSRIKQKLIGILIGIPAIFAINQVRVISLFLLGRKYPDIFEEVHVYVWQPIVIIFAILVWDFWARNFVKKDKIQKSPVSD
ncbi:MAG: exosortase H [Candidatus Zixiibacteriota bacterium]